MLEGVIWCDDAYSTMENADVLVIVTEWNEFRSLDLKRMMKLLRAPVVVDLRNVYEPEEMWASGFRYTSIGRPRHVHSGE
jgi:UDPglucose 6-dehydrogenase